MQTTHGFAFVGLGLVILACSSGGLGTLGSNSDGGSSDGGAADAAKKNDAKPTTACPDGSRFFNGECRDECRENAPCSDASLHCIEVEEGETALCLPYADCTYLGDDTQCVASGGTYTYVFSRSSMSNYQYVPYESTPNADPNATTGFVDPYFYGGGMRGPCAGDAKWVTTAAATPVGCTQTYMVNRCRLVGTRCELVRGTTREFVKP